ncbi:MAG: hypothetical protein IT439_04505 [Phycisphaerales bacterium]|nr:hypothetical protein [Phycisphaerales bacterium]
MSEPTPTPESAGGAPAPPPADVLKSAFGAFKKRYKLTVLDRESSLGASKPMTGGRSASGMGIRPPDQFPREVWQELARQGRIRDLGGGYYAMP